MRPRKQAAFAAFCFHGNNPRHTQFGSLLDSPFKMVKLDERQIQRDPRPFRPRLNLFQYPELHQILPHHFHFRQPHTLVVRNFKRLPHFNPQHAREVVCVLTGNFSLALVDLIDKESAACHVHYVSYLMISLLRGILVEKHPNQAILDVGGVGYDVTIPISTFSLLPDTGVEVLLRIHTHVREDILALYGFVTQDERNLFLKLVGVSGIGPGLAIKVLSGMPATDLLNAIRRNELDRLVRIPGVGKKTAERIVLELRDKLPAPSGEDAASAKPSLSRLDEDVLSALLNLGCARPAAEAAIRKARTEGTPDDFEPLFRKALELVR